MLGDIIGGHLGLYTIIVLGLIGFLASLASYIEFNRGLGSPFCRPGSKIDCLAVYSMPHAWIAGFHLSQLAPFFYTFILLLGVTTVIFNSTIALKLLALLSLEVSIVVPYLVYLMVRYAKAICIYCLTMYITSILTTILTYRVIIEMLT